MQFILQPFDKMVDLGVLCVIYVSENMKFIQGSNYFNCIITTL